MLDADISRLRSLDGVKWTRYGPDVVPAWVADMDFDVAPEIKEAMQTVIDRGDLGYNFAAIDELVPTWADWQATHHRRRPVEGHCQVFTGALHALEVAMTLRSRPGDGVAVFSPIYAPFRNAIVDSGRRIVDVPLDGPDWRLDAERFEAQLDPDTRVVLFSQPHNPLGRVFTTEEIAGFAEVVERHGLLVISDEIWGDLTHGCEHTPLASAEPGLLPNLVTIGSASKTFNLAGLRCAVAEIGSADLRASIAAFPSHLIGRPNTLGAVATIAAWTKAAPWLADMRARLTSNRDHLADRVAEDLPGVDMHRPEATYLAWLDFTGTPIADDPSKHLLKRAGIALEPGAKFGPQATANARVNFATSVEILDLVVDRIATLLQGPDTEGPPTLLQGADTEGPPTLLQGPDTEGPQ